jgi:sulfate/thiosulfate transport system permease protein
LKLTALLVITATVINTIAGIGLAWVLVRHQFPGKHLIDAMVDLPFVVSPVIVGYVIIVLFGREGWFAGIPFKVAFSWPGMLLVTIFVSLPFVTREVMPVLAAMTPEQEEAAYTLGASHILTFRRIIIPSIWRGILYGIILTMARALGEFGAVAVAGGGIRGVTETSTLFIFRALHDRNYIGAYSVAVLLGALSVVILLVMNSLRAPSARKT